MLFSKNITVLLICLSIKIGKMHGFNLESVTYNVPFDDIEIIDNSLTTPGLAFVACNSTEYTESKISCILARETVKDFSSQNHLQFCNVTASLSGKIFRKKTDALDDNRAIMFIEFVESVTLLIIDLSNCQFITSSLYKLYVPFASVHGSNGQFFDILYKDEFSKNNRRWTLDVNGTIITTPQDGSFKYFNKDEYLYSPTKERLLFGQPTLISEMGLYAVNNNGSIELLKEFPFFHWDETSSSSLSSYGFLSACFKYKNSSAACTQYNSNGTLKFETIIIPKGILPYLTKVQNLPNGGLLLLYDACMGIEYHNQKSIDECQNYKLLSKISPTGQDLGQLRIPRPICQTFTGLRKLRFFQKENGDFCLSLICGYTKHFQLSVNLTCFKNEEFQNVIE